MNLKKIYIAHTNCITPLGFDVESNIRNIENGISGISLQDNKALMASLFYAGVIEDEKLEAAFDKISNAVNFTRLEKMMILALYPIVQQAGRAITDKTVFIVSTTKGNITSRTKLFLPCWYPLIIRCN